MSSNRSSDRSSGVTAWFRRGARRAAGLAGAPARAGALVRPRREAVAVTVAVVAALLASGVAAAQDGGANGGDTTTLLLYVGIGVIALVLAFAAVLYLRRALAPETEDPLGR